MEDAHMAVLNSKELEGVLGVPVSLYGVFDGHGGAAVSEWLARHMPRVTAQVVASLHKDVRPDILIAPQSQEWKELVGTAAGTRSESTNTSSVEAGPGSSSDGKGDADFSAKVVALCEGLQRAFLKLDEEMQKNVHREEIRRIHDQKAAAEAEDSRDGRGNEGAGKANTSGSLLAALLSQSQNPQNKSPIRLLERNGVHYFSISASDDDSDFLPNPASSPSADDIHEAQAEAQRAAIERGKLLGGVEIAEVESDGNDDSEARSEGEGKDEHQKKNPGENPENSGTPDIPEETLIAAAARADSTGVMGAETLEKTAQDPCHEEKKEDGEKEGTKEKDQAGRSKGVSVEAVLEDSHVTAPEIRSPALTSQLLEKEIKEDGSRPKSPLVDSPRGDHPEALSAEEEVLETAAINVAELQKQHDQYKTGADASSPKSGSKSTPSAGVKQEDKQSREGGEDKEGKESMGDIVVETDKKKESVVGGKEGEKEGEKEEKEESGAEESASNSNSSSDDGDGVAADELNDNDADMDDFDRGLLPSGGPESCGAAVVVAAVVGGPKPMLIVANAGDSRCVLCREGRAFAMSEDHKPQNEIELNRIEKAGGRVIGGRVDGNLNLSRTLGDLFYKKNPALPPQAQKISGYPDIKVLPIFPADQFVILACDGIWDCLTNQGACDFVLQRLPPNPTPKDLSDIAEQMCDHCLAENPMESEGIGCDNMTCIIVVSLSRYTHTD